MRRCEDAPCVVMLRTLLKWWFVRAQDTRLRPANAEVSTVTSSGTTCYAKRKKSSASGTRSRMAAGQTNNPQQQNAATNFGDRRSSSEPGGAGEVETLPTIPPGSLASFVQSASLDESNSSSSEAAARFFNQFKYWAAAAYNVLRHLERLPHGYCSPILDDGTPDALGHAVVMARCAACTSLSVFQGSSEPNLATNAASDSANGDRGSTSSSTRSTTRSSSRSANTGGAPNSFPFTPRSSDHSGVPAHTQTPRTVVRHADNCPIRKIMNGKFEEAVRAATRAAAFESSPVGAGGAAVDNVQQPTDGSTPRSSTPPWHREPHSLQLGSDASTFHGPSSNQGDLGPPMTQDPRSMSQLGVRGTSLGPPHSLAVEFSSRPVSSDSVNDRLQESRR